MNAVDWQKFLEEWSRAILASPYVETFNLPIDAVASKWLGFEGATEAQIAAAEVRLGVGLPPSYRGFLKVSNGWRHTGTYIQRILPVEDIYWLRDTTDESLLDHAELYIQQMSAVPFNPEYDQVNYAHFKDTLVIAEPTEEQELFLLNPQAKSTEGEWQAWTFAHWIPGVEAYDSFQALLETERDTVVNENQLEAQRFSQHDDAQTMYRKLATLIQQLEDDFNFYHPAPDETRTNHLAYHINKLTAEGIEEVLNRVRQLQRTTLDPASLRVELEAIAKEYQDQHAQSLPGGVDMSSLIQSLSQVTGPDDPTLQTLSNRMLQYSFLNGKAQGYTNAAAKIRFFLQKL